MATSKVTNCFSNFTPKEFGRIETAAEQMAKDAGRGAPLNEDYAKVVEGIIDALKSKLGLATQPEQTNQAQQAEAGESTAQNKADYGDPSEAEAKQVETAVNGKNPVDAAKWIAQNAPSEALREVARAVAGALNRLQGQGLKLKPVKVAQVGEQVPMALTRARGISHYVYGKGMPDAGIQVWLNGSSVKGKVGVSFETALHELVHAATQSAIRLGNLRVSAGKPVADAVQRLYAVNNAIIREFNARVKESKSGGRTLTPFEQALFDRRNNAFSNPDETVTWALTNLDAQQWLDGITYKPTGKTLWASLVEAIGRFLGISPKADSALQEVLSISQELLNTDVSQLDELASASGTNMQVQAPIGEKTDSSVLTKPSYMDKAPSELWDTAKGAMLVVKDWAFTRGAFTQDLLTAAAKMMPAARTYLEQMQAAGVESRHLQRQVADIVDRAANLSVAERGTGPVSINKLISDMTYDNKWAFKPDWYPQATVDPVMKSRFNALSPEARKVVVDVFKQGHESLLAAQRAAIESIASEVDPLIAAAKASGDMATVKELEKAKVEADGKFRRLVSLRSTTPYAPLRRFGNWAVVVKSKMYQDAQARKDTAALEKLARDGNHYHVEFVSNQLVARSRAKELQAEMGDAKVEHFERSDDNMLYGGESMFKAFSRFRTLAREKMDGESTRVVSALDKTLASMYMSLIAETSARTSEFSRKSVKGASEDMMKAFATQGLAMAHFIGSLKTSGKIMETLRTLKGQSSEPATGDRAEASKMYNEIMRRHAMGMDYEPNQWLDKSLAFNSYWSLITSPSYLLTNLTQPWVVSVPVLAGKFGVTASMKAMGKAYGDVAKIATKLVDNPEAVRDLPPDVQAAVQTLFDRGRIDISLGADLGSFSSPGGSDLSAAAQKAIRFPRTLVERGEMVNRVATAVAAYRLAKQRGMSVAESTDYADKVIYDTHGDYSAFNAPRVMRTGLGRFATQFRKFQLIQLSMYARLIHDARKGMTVEERVAARAALGYSLGAMFALGGVVALPGYTAISFLLGSVLGFGDDDEPDDPEATMRRFIGNEAVADLLVRGVPNAMGLNLGSRLGAAGMLSILPYTDLEASRDGYKDILLGLAGPFVGGTLPKALDGVGLMASGDYWKGLEMLLPRGLADAAKGVRFAEEGLTKRNGDVVLNRDEINWFEASLQAVGLPTTDITNNQMLRNSQFKADEFYKDRTSELKKAYVEAYRSGDGAELQEIRQRWADTQKARKELGFEVQPLSTLIKAPQEQQKREAKPMNLELVQ